MSFSRSPKFSPYLFAITLWLGGLSLFYINNKTFHDHCQLSQPKTLLGDWGRSIICGCRLPYGPIKTQLVQWGLIHLFVTSGAHIYFLKTWIELLIPTTILKKILTHLSLFLLVFASSMSAPLIRAYTLFQTRILHCHFKLFWKPRHLMGGTTMGILILNPIWASSTSFQLSTLCGLYFCYINKEQNSPKQTIKSSLHLFMLLTPLLIQWSQPRVESILINGLIAPVVGSGLIPLVILQWVIPDISEYLSPHINHFFENIGQWSGTPIPFQAQKDLGTTGVWIYITIVGLIYELTYGKGPYFSRPSRTPKCSPR